MHRFLAFQLEDGGAHMAKVKLALSADEYVLRREAYCYADPCWKFEVVQTGSLAHAGVYHGVYASSPPPGCIGAVNLRRFELICGEVFADGFIALRKGSLTANHAANLQSIALAIVHWKMASQRGRARKAVERVGTKWSSETAQTLLEAYDHCRMGSFRIPGVRIPTATAFMRFLFPDKYGIMDRLVGCWTNSHGITTLKLRSDGYVCDTSSNIEQYEQSYIPFLRSQALELTRAGKQFRDVSACGEKGYFSFRPCDVEMALWQSISSS